METSRLLSGERRVLLLQAVFLAERETSEQNLRDRGQINEMQIAFKSARACLPASLRFRRAVRFGGLTLGFN